MRLGHIAIADDGQGCPARQVDLFGGEAELMAQEAAPQCLAMLGAKAFRISFNGFITQLQGFFELPLMLISQAAGGVMLPLLHQELSHTVPYFRNKRLPGITAFHSLQSS